MLSMLTVLQFTLLLVAQAFVILFLAATRESLKQKMQQLEADVQLLRSSIGAGDPAQEARLQRSRTALRTVMRPIA